MWNLTHQTGLWVLALGELLRLLEYEPDEEGTLELDQQRLQAGGLEKGGKEGKNV